MLANVYDLPNSYATFITLKKENMTRIPIEAACRIQDKKKNPEEFFLITSCKSENVYVEKGLFKTPNYDWCGIFSENDYTTFRTYAVHNP